MVRRRVASPLVGTPLVMSKRLGHSSVTPTGDHLSHVVDHVGREAANLTADLIVRPVTRGDRAGRVGQVGGRVPFTWLSALPTRS